MILLCIMTIISGILIGYLVCAILREYELNDLLDTERENFKKSLDDSYSLLETERAYFKKSFEEREELHKSFVAGLIKEHKDELAEYEQRKLQMLNEIAKVTGIDTVDLPSFGTVHLNRSIDKSED